ncbi:uncharacterized protein F4822DRAFT_307701 [Hypoxylon trugodes]|uniref:uncharacterized protein n=1 Tax=Hypoxylon trugodes TaxID=326681 RepID=UPI00219AFAAF|nr:uncharacterized protein F4822DRAFT_307701 [Hypoxylon trugodes]KAI1386186.1 hypothetical protein F4822DRAFT_307701 [Hypoxylon trugodes]
MSELPVRPGKGSPSGGGGGAGRSRTPPVSFSPGSASGTDAEEDEDELRRPTWWQAISGVGREQIGGVMRPRDEDSSSTSKDRRGSRSAFEAAIAAAKQITLPMENAVDDSEDMSDDEVEVRSNYGRRHQSNAGARGDPKFARVHEILPFPFHPNVRPLTVSDLESCVALEDAAFANPEHRCTREKFEYRLSVCPELCLGLFCTIVPDKAGDFEISTFATAHPVETSRDNGARSVLVAHIVSTRSYGAVVTDAAMDYPRDFRTKKRNNTDLGHQDAGQTICLHSLAVHPKLHGCHLGKLIMKAYLQQIQHADMAERVALICQDYLVDFYEKFGFKNQGQSKAQFGGGGWNDMVVKTADIPPYSSRR